MASPAYDFDLFLPSQKQEEEKIIQVPELKVVEGSDSGRRGHFALYSVIAFLIIASVMSAIIYNNVRLTELTARYEATEHEYEELVEEGARMKVELSEMVSLRTVEERASNELKMAKAEDYQIEYVDLGTKSVVVKCENTPDNLGEKAKSLWLSAMEYIKK